jgi:hypothetical protein
MRKQGNMNKELSPICLSIRDNVSLSLTSTDFTNYSERNNLSKREKEELMFFFTNTHVGIISKSVMGILINRVYVFIDTLQRVRRSIGTDFSV